MNLDEFCGSKFWDHNVTWNTPYPDLTLCFEHTVLVWIPCIFLWIMSAVQVPLLLRRKVPLPDGSTQPTLTEGTGPGNSGGPENRANSKPSVPPVPKPSGILKITQNPRIVVSCLKFFVILALLGVHVLWLVASLVTYDISNAFLTAEILRISTYLLVLLMMCIHVKKQVRSSGTIFIFWFLSAVCGVFEFQTRIREAIASDGGYDYFVLQLAMAHYIGVFSSFLFQCWADSWFPVLKYRRMISPEENASFLSRITLFWFNKLIKTGFRKTLEKGDLWEPREVDKSATQVPVFFKYWSYYRINRKTNLLRVLCRMFGPESAMGALCKLVQDCLAFVAPFVLRLLMTFVQEKDNPDSYVWHGIFFVAILFLANIFQSLFLNNYQKTMFQISMHVRTVVISAIYQKSLRISPKGRKEIDGETVNLMTTDVLRLETTIQKLCNAWSAPLQIIVSIYLLWGILGASVLGGVVVMVLLTPVNVYVGILTRNFRVEMNKSKDKRVKLMNEILNGIKVLKLYAWEPSFEKQVESFRTEEIRIIRKQACVEIFTNFVWNCAPVLVSLVTFGTYILIDENNVLDTEKAFVALVLFKMMNLPITLLPQTFNLLAECIVSLERLNKFLNAEEMDRTAVIEDLHEADPVVIENGNFAWVEKNACLKNINVRIEPGKLVAIVGTVGSGKSSLLNAMLGEMLRVSGRVKRQGKVAYVAQQAWILNAMLQSNIVFGKNIRDSSRSYFNKVVKACALYLDIKRLPNKTLTEIGEKGVNLSGGQKQRVSLARAAFSEADLILLDDPLSAVDAHVGKHIFEELIGPKGLLKLKTRIMVTHGIAYLPQVDQIIVMKDGEISEEGTYSELMERKGAFAEYIEEHNQSKETEGREEVMSMQEELIVPEGDEDVRPSTSAAIHKTLLCDRHEGSDIEHDIHDELNEGLEQSDMMITSSELDKGTQLISNLGASAEDSMLNEVDNKPTSPKSVVKNCLPTSSNTVIHDVDLKRQSRIGQEQLSPIGSRKSSMSSNDKVGTPESEELETSVNFLQTGVRKPSIDDGSPEIAGLGDSSLQNGLKRDSIISFDLEETEPCEHRASGPGIQQQTICPNQSVKKRGGQKSRVVELLPESNVGFNPPEKIIKEELMQSGNVKLNVYWDYLKSIGPLYAISGITFAILLQVFLIGSSVWLSIWSRSAKEGDAESRNWFLIIYGLIGLCQTICASIANACQSMGMIRGAQNLHRQLLRNILRSPMSFFDTTPVGRIISRFSSDVDSVDTSFPAAFKAWLLFLLTVVATVVLITVITPWTLVAVIPLGVVYYILQKVYIVTSTQLQRLESVSKSPIFSHFSETLTGCTTIRAYGAQEGFILKSEALVDSNIRCFYPTIVANVWLCLRLEMIGNLFVFFAGLFAVLGRNSLSAGSIGLSLTYAFQVTQTLSWLMKLTPLVETNAVAIERLKEYDSTPKEAPWEIPENKPDATWPESGVVSFQEYKTRYRDNLEMVLRDTSFETSAAQKIGIVGRTGAGKSSLSLALFRMIESQGGKIVIDNKNIATLGLHDVRSRITIIPQEPFLFSGTIRMNIDPFGKYSDEQIWNALEMAHLKVFVSGLDSGLDYEVTANEGSFNLSAGQQQLICLARAVLRKSKILVLDEATAAVDLSTDDLIQQTIRHEFQDSTVLTIAHRLNTIMDSDKILVLDYGHVKEFDTPANLLKQKRSIFYQLAKEAGVI